MKKKTKKAPKKAPTKICQKCQKKINSEEKGVTWITFEGDKELEVIHWHWKCFEEWKNESIENKAKKVYAESMKKILPGFAGNIEGMIENAQAKANEMINDSQNNVDVMIHNAKEKPQPIESFI